MITGTMIRGGCCAGNKHWTAAEREQLGELYLQSPRPIAELLGRSVAAVTTEASRMGLRMAGVAVAAATPT
jgi:hypothetical protein